MNKTFKVARSLTRGTVVTSEKASSYQGKAVKTVIAAAVASLVAGAAMAATPTTFSEITLGDGTNVTIKAGDKSTVTGTVEGKDDASTPAKATFKENDKLAETAAVTLKNGSLNVEGATQTVGSVAGNGTITINADKTNVAALTVNDASAAAEQTFQNFNVNLGVVNDASTGKTAGLEFKNASGQKFESGTLKTTVVATNGTGATHGVASLKSAGDLTFGKSTEKTDHGSIKVEGSAYNFDIQADTTVSGTNVKLLNSNVAVAEGSTLTVSATTNVDVADEVAFQNKGLVKVAAGSNLTFDADYDATAGKLELSGSNVTVNGTITGGELQVGGYTTNDKGVITDTANVALAGKTSNKIGATGAVSVDTLSFKESGVLTVDATNSNGTTLKGSLEAAATKVGVSGASLNVSGTASLGAVTIDSLKDTGDKKATFTLTVDKDATAAADSLTIVAAQAEDQAAGLDKKNAGEFILTGALDVGTVANNGTITLNADSELSIVAAGESTNAGTISGSGTLAVAKDVALTNTKEINLGTDGTLEVVGTLTNAYTPAVVADKKVTTAAKFGTITAKSVTIGNGGVVDTEFGISDSGAVGATPTDADTYTVQTTTIEEGGKFVTSLNGKVVDSDNDNNIVELKGNFVLAGGEIVDRAASAAVSDLKLAAGKSLTTTADYSFGKILASGADSAFNVSGGNVKVADLQTSGTAIDNGGALEVTALTAAANTVKVNDGTLTVSLATLNTAYDATKKTLVDDNTNKEDTVANAAIDTIGANGVLVVTDYQGAETAVDLKDANGIARLLADNNSKVNKNNFKGLIDLGNVTFSEIKADPTTGRYAYNDLIHGVTTDAYKQASVDVSEASDANKIAQSESFGNIYTGANGLTISGGSTVTLNNAAANGFLVWHEERPAGATAAVAKVSNVALQDGSTLVVAATGAVGNVTKNTSGNLSVAEAGDLTAQNVDVTTLDVAGKLNIAEAASGADAYTITTGNLNVTGVLNAAANNLTVTSTSGYVAGAEDPFSGVSSIAGSASVKNLTASGDLLITGTATVADTLDAVGNVYVGNDEKAGSLVVSKLVSGSTVFADPAWVDGKSTEASKIAVGAGETDTSVVAGRNSVVFLGITAEEDLNAASKTIENSGYTLAETSTAEADDVRAEETKTVNSILYVDGSKTYLGNASATDLTIASFETTTLPLADQVYVQKNSMLVLDAAKVDTTGVTAVFDKNVVMGEDSVLFIDNLTNGSKIKLSQGYADVDSATVAYTGDLVMGWDTVRNDNDATKPEGTIAVSMIENLDRVGFTGAGADLAYAYFAEGVNATGNSNAFLNKLLTSSTTFADIYQPGDDFADYAGLANILNEGAAIGATTGVQTMTMDAVNQMADTVADRTSILTQRGQGVNVWADVNGGKFEAKTLFDGAGYSSDIYSGVLGLDYQFSCNAVLGAALTIGTADTDSKNTAFKSSTDSDLVGFSVYASKTFADIWNVSADIGYLQASNEVKTNGYGVAYKFDQDTDAFTVGVRGEVLTKAGAVNIVPHVGLRYTALSTDSADALYQTEVDDMNVFQMPVGVALSADFETSGWTIAPKFDLSVVPTFGDKDAELKLGLAGVSATATDSVSVIDSNPVQAQLGVNATNGAWGFGLSYKLGVGSEDRMNNSFNANVRYAF